MNPATRHTLDLRIVGRLFEFKTPDRGPEILTLQVNHGKDKNGNFKPSTFIDIKVFPSKRDQVLRINPDKGDILEVIAWGSTDEWVNKEGVKQRKISWAMSDAKLVERKAKRDAQLAARHDPEPLMEIDDIPF
jgi:hypothetical protein